MALSLPVARDRTTVHVIISYGSRPEQGRTSRPTPGYVWHCHMLGHEDHDMMRPLPMVFLWKPE